MQRHLKLLQKHGEDVHIVDEARPFRFGGGPRIMPSYAVIMPLHLAGASKTARVRVSVVDQEVPLLLSKSTLKGLGMVMDLEKGKILFREMKAEVPLRETKAGLCGFQINTRPSRTRWEVPPRQLVEDDHEIVIGEAGSDQVCMADNPVQNDGLHDKVRATYQNVQRCEDEARKLYHAQDYSFEAITRLVRMLPFHTSKRHRAINGGKGKGYEAWVAGIYSHGAWTGVTKRTLRYPNVVRYVNMFMRSHTDGEWSSFTLMKNVSTEVHVDRHNDKQALATTVTFGDFEGGQLWVADEEVSDSECTWKQGNQGEWIRGRLCDTYRRPLQFDPHVPHATHDWKGERWCLSCYSVRTAAQVDDQMRKAMKKMKFPLARKEVTRTFGKQQGHTYMSSNHPEPLKDADDVDVCDELNATPQLKLSRSTSPGIEYSVRAECGKEDYVIAVSGRCKVKPEELRAHTLDRLKELWAVVKPPRKGSCLPAGWRKMDLETLKEVYASHVVEDVGRDHDNHWGRWSRSQLIMELEMWAVEANAALNLDRDLEMADPGPLCTVCGIPMVQRNNRLTHEPFWGCRRFPACRTTLPYTYDNRPTKEVQKELRAAAMVKIKEEKNFLPKERPKNRRSPPQGGATASSDHSWHKTGPVDIESSDNDEPNQLVNTNLTEEEVELVMEMRKKKAGNVKGKGHGNSSDEKCVERRRRLKKGVAKRLLGNARAIVAGVFIATAALAGAAAEAVPYASRIRPDVVEVGTTETHFQQSFSRWGWRSQRCEHLAGDLAQADNREAVMNWVDQVCPRIRRKVHHDEEGVSELRWNEKNILRALKQWNVVYAQGDEMSDDDGDEEMIPDPQEPRSEQTEAAGEEQARGSQEPNQRVRPKLASGGITFEVPAGRRLSEAIRHGLIKAHCNLGHPSKEDLARFLKLGGARKEVVEAVNWMKCVTCAHARRPSTHRTTNMPPCQLEFGDEVQLDCLCIRDANKENFWFLSILDRATSYHVLEMLRDHSPLELHRAFDRGWSKWAGVPSRVTTDLEGGFIGPDFWTKVSQSGSSLVSIAGTAHFQAGKIERHNSTIKDMLFATIRQTATVGREDMRKLAREVACAKNSLVREHGWAPVALVFGREPRVFGEMYHQGNPTAYHPSVGEAGSDVASRMRFRYHAKMEFVRSQARQMLLRTAHNRTRRLPIPKIGQMVFFWRAEKSKKGDSQSKWVGPGYVVGLQDGNAWVAVGGRCFLVAGEHLREAVGDEKHYGNPEVQKEVADELMTDERSLDTDGLSDEHAQMSGQVGWHVDSSGSPVLVSYKAWAFRTPEPRYPGERFPFRTSWVHVNGHWECVENEVKWMELEDQHQFIPQAPVAGLITIFRNRTRKDVVLDDVPLSVKRRKQQSPPQQVHVANAGSQSKTKLKRMLEKEIPYANIPEKDRELYRQAEEKEWKSWQDYESCEILSLEESQRMENERPDRILPSRYVFRNKNAGLLDANGKELPVKAKARLCLQGHLCPDSRTGQVQVDSPTIERVSTMVFLHMVTSLGWTGEWFIGDISNAFLQGQILKLLKPVYGRPDAPRAWYNELARILEEEMGFSKCKTDPAMFALRDQQGNLQGLMVVHVDDVMFCHNGSEAGRQVEKKLTDRFPFGTWMKVSEQKSGVTYCGKEINVIEKDGETCVTLAQNAFIDGRLQTTKIDPSRLREPDARANSTEVTDYRSITGSLQWLAVQSRPDIAFECNQLQKRIADLRVSDLIRANKAVREVSRHRTEILFRPLGHDAELVTYHDAGLYSSVGVEIDEKQSEDILQSHIEKRLIYSQKGACIGFVKKGAIEQEGRVHLNLIDWKSATNRRVIESSFAAETHAAIMGHNMSRFAQVLLCELKYGSRVMSAVEDDGWQQLVPLTMVTDCKSIYDTIHKDGQHVGEKGNIVHAVLLRQQQFEAVHSHKGHDTETVGDDEPRAETPDSNTHPDRELPGTNETYHKPNEIHHNKPNEIHHNKPDEIHHNKPDEIHHNKPDEMYHNKPDEIYPTRPTATSPMRSTCKVPVKTLSRGKLRSLILSATEAGKRQKRMLQQAGRVGGHKKLIWEVFAGKRLTAKEQ
ncbi:RE1 [Symbiodinium sp. CCMP2592]|nr:RE1 [Symbiodinium sp. CCMP2592]